MTTETMICASCGAVLAATDATTFDGQILCESCLEERTLICHECNERIWADDNAGNSEVVLCQSCYDRRFTHCTRCGTLLRDTYVYYAEDDSGEEEELCYSCFTHISPGKPIADYYYKPEPVFYGTGSRYFGVELEIDGGGELSPNARKLINLANADAVRIYCKHDGSLDDGFEIVTHPMTLEYHLKEMPWERILGEAVSMGYCSHKSGTCGLHVHVSRCAFGDTEGSQDAAIARILFFVERHWYELLKFSRRTNRQLERWAARYGYKEQPMDILDHAKKDPYLKLSKTKSERSNPRSTIIYIK